MDQSTQVLPDFIIIGAMKSGTTTLYRYLAEHPQIAMSRDKETDYFVAEKNFSKGLDWYSNQFDPAPGLIRGEASPNYTKSRDFPGVPSRIAEVCPDVKLIYVVRDPVKRAVSQFRHSFIQGTLNVDSLTGFDETHEYAHIMDASHYAQQLEIFAEHFPKSAFLVLDFDELVENPQASINRILDHINADQMLIDNTGAQNDSTQLSRVPAPILRFAQSSAGRRLAGMIGRDTRDRIRVALARGTPRTPPEFPRPLLDKMQAQLASDVAAFRKMTGQPFAGWSI